MRAISIATTTTAMPPATHTVKEEEAFLNDLLSGLNESFFDAVPSPDPSPAKPTRTRNVRNYTPVKPKRETKSPLITKTEDVDMAALMEGAEDWDWDDMEADFLTPKKKTQKRDPIKSSGSEYTRETCTRCIVEQIDEIENGGRYEKVRLRAVEVTYCTKTLAAPDSQTRSRRGTPDGHSTRRLVIHRHS